MFTDKMVGWFMVFIATFNNIPVFSGFTLLSANEEAAS
jgi:hypothetical protein